ncbi:diguanylate cyclase domain-containing protein [Chitinilyticum litopenaei]|uniref:diguanylate cyclase domain-containing protein n=1 Tax=Chitinilyticum litopenaei TaxID=1121276 RepID=UPI0004163647|nr:diguanylate cyclase [Chitinilyticum litopenaei]
MTLNPELNHRPRILIVDDSRIVRATIRKHLGEQYELLEEADGEAGWRRLQADDDISLLISDLTMPELDGIGLLSRVRQQPDERFQYLPVIIISGEEDEETRQRCVESGASDFISKSTDRSEMLARVKANLDLAVTRRELAVSRALQEQQALTDHETGVGSQNLLMLQLEQSLAFALRHNGEVTLLLLEIDHFQGLRDKLGDRAAQQMLGLLAKLLEAKLRREDTLARLDEARFAVVSPATTLTEAKILAERLRQAMANARINFRNEQVHVTGSIAVANSWHDDAASAAALIGMANTRLYAESGDNRVTMPDMTAVRTQTPLIAEALVMLGKGMRLEVREHLPSLMHTLIPLLEMANEEMGLDWSLDRLRDPGRSAGG